MATQPAKRSVWILGDQLTLDHPGLTSPDDVRVVMIESRRRMRRIRYHSYKLVLIRSAMRHFAEILRGAGYEVDYRQNDDGFLDALKAHAPISLVVMASGDFHTRRQQLKLAAQLDIPVDVLPNRLMLANRLREAGAEQPVKTILELFYRDMRKKLGLLVDERGKPEGGVWNLDAENRKGWTRGKSPAPPPAPRFAPDDITRAAIDEVAAEFPDAFGDPHGFEYGVTRADALHALDDFVRHRLTLFGTYEDAMASNEVALYHSQLTPYLNVALLDPLECAEAVVKAYSEGHAPLNSVEGFLRQIVGWREYMYQKYWELMPGLVTANHYGHTRDLPPFFWGDGKTEMHCVQSVIDKVIENGWSHHIERLMVIGNWCLIAGIEPSQVNDWFLALYVDAYDWVVPPNVIGMSLYADGGKIGTKPYFASGSYINRQSDYCEGCRYDPKQRVGPDACPFNSLYWNFVDQHQAELAANMRTRQMTLGLGRLKDLDEVRAQAREFLIALPKPERSYAQSE